MNATNNSKHRPSRRWDAQRVSHIRRKRRKDTDDLEFVLSVCPGYNLGKAYKRVTRAFEEEFRASDLSLPQFAILVNTDVSGSATATEVAHRLGSDLSTISRTMEHLVRRNLVIESRGTDRRVRVYRLSPAGREALREALSKWSRARRKVMKNLSAGEWESALTTIRRLGN